MLKDNETSPNKENVAEDKGDYNQILNEMEESFAGKLEPKEPLTKK